MSMDPILFRHLCGRFATGVTVVTAIDPQGHPVGMTVNSFAAVSLEPGLVSVNIDHRAELHELLTGADRFAINVLESRQEALSRGFAENRRERFAGVDYRIGRGGAPLITGALAVLECERHLTFAAGDHTIVVGLVVAGEVWEGSPLLFYQGEYHAASLTPPPGWPH